MTSTGGIILTVWVWPVPYLNNPDQHRFRGTAFHLISQVITLRFTIHQYKYSTPTQNSLYVNLSLSVQKTTAL